MRYRFSAYYAMGIESVLFYPKLGYFGGYRVDFLVLKAFWQVIRKISYDL